MAKKKAARVSIVATPSSIDSPAPTMQANEVIPVVSLQVMVGHGRISVAEINR